MRKFWFIYITKGIIIWPGGVGTLDEFFDMRTLLQTKKITRKIPIILFGKDFWDGKRKYHFSEIIFIMQF